jgi:hypothetical protein
MKPAKKSSSARKTAVLECIARGERAVTDGKTVSHAEAKKRLSPWLR